MPAQAGLAGWPLVALLATIQLAAFSDRFLLTLVATPLKQALALSDTQLGLLQGSAFALPYALALPLLGIVADSGRQRGLLVGGVLLWSAATFANGLAGGFSALLAARLILGLGQSAFGPAALSLMSLHLRPDRLGRGLSALTAAATLGRSVALLAGGAVLAWLTARGGLAPPALGSLAPWQALLVLAALPNVILAILVLRIRPSPRVATPIRWGGERRLRRGPSLRDALAWIGRRRRTYLPHAAAATAAVLMTQTLTAWAPTFYVRAFGFSPAESGLRLGLLVLIAAPLGHAAGGFALDRMRSAGRADAAPLLLALGLALALPMTALASLSPDLPLSLVGFAGLVALLGFTSPPGLAGIQILTPRALRGRVNALFLATVTLAGYGLGPLLVGLLSDHLFGEAGLGLALLAVYAPVGGLGAVAALAARRAWGPIRRSTR
ncbi:major facilitator transporter [Methylorubrum populi]|uniref:Major facilitator transporter n=1 Tax=Methylorubrum populi TaxID=223967 RepID=A0A160PAM9_9HYPH|nr:MFS transporter [Methylorubrum populi]BAU89234.1 major facilitator transporter [Methylorubrum populi]